MSDRAGAEMSKHDADCIRRKVDHPHLCTCGVTDAEVAQAHRVAGVVYDNGFARKRIPPESWPTSTEHGATIALDYLAEFFADDLVALRQQRIHSFNPPAAFVDRVVAKMVEDGASVESARADLADLWVDCKALDDVGRTV